MKKIAALLTDLDGTLIHSVDPICAALHACFLHVGATPPPKQAIIDMFGLPVEVMLTTLTEVKAEETERVAEFIAEYKRQYPVHMARAKLIDGALETMEYFHASGVKVCLITNERKKNARFILDTLGLSRSIEYMITRDDVEHFKPDPEPLLKAAALVGEKIDHCAYIGESPFDIQAGVKSGIYTIGVPSGNWSAEALEACGPDVMIDEISALKTLLCAEE